LENGHKLEEGEQLKLEREIYELLKKAD